MRRQTRFPFRRYRVGRIVNLLGFAVIAAIAAYQYATQGRLTGVPTGVSVSRFITADRDCRDFATRAEAQAFFNSQGPDDPHRLDEDGDGRACELNR